MQERLRGAVKRVVGFDARVAEHVRLARENALVDALLERPAPAVPSRTPVSTALVERLTPEDVAELDRRVTPEQRVLLDGSPRVRVNLTVAHGLDDATARMGLLSAAPPDDVHAMARGALAAGGDAGVADVLVTWLEDAGVVPGEGATVLDFGCSSGRVLRVLAAWRPDLACVGCDPNAPAIAWAQQHLHVARFLVSPTRPPVPELDDASVDLAYAISIWSHFDEASGRRWLDELRRVVRPGGHLVLTTHGPDAPATGVRRGTMTRGSAAEAGAAMLGGRVCFFDVFGTDGDWGVRDAGWGNSFLTAEWLLAAATPEWACVAFWPGALDAVQDVVVLERRR